MKRPTGHTIWPNLWPPHFRTFCLVEGEENKLTTFSTWTRSSAFDLLGPSASRCTGSRSSYTSGPPVDPWPLQEVFTLQGERHCTYYQQQGGKLYRRFVNFGNTALLFSSNPGPAGSGARRTHAILSRDRAEDDEKYLYSVANPYVRVRSMVRPLWSSRGAVYLPCIYCTLPTQNTHNTYVHFRLLVM